MGYIKVQLKSGNTVSIPMDQYFSMSDDDWDELMSSEYGTYLPDVFSSSKYNNKNFEKFDDLDFDYEED
jgi:hypothetical protein